MNTKLDFRRPADRKIGSSAYYTLQQPVCSAEKANLALQWMSYCTRSGRLYYGKP